MNLALTLVIQGVVFFLVAWAVMKFFWPWLMGAIEERQKKIAEGLAAAAQERKGSRARPRRAPRKSSAKRATARRRSSIRRASARTKSSRKPRAPPRPKRSGLSRRRTMKWRAKARGRAKACARKWASSRSKAPRACSGARSIRRPTPSCWTNSPPRSRVAERATIARPYAKAAFEYARDANAFAAVVAGAESSGRDRRRSARRRAHQESASGRRRISPASSSTSRAQTRCRHAELRARARGESPPAAAAGDRGALRERCAPHVENTVDVEVISAVALDAAQADEARRRRSARG